jgi:hypothetical protein
VDITGGDGRLIAHGGLRLQNIDINGMKPPLTKGTSNEH